MKRFFRHNILAILTLVIILVQVAFIAIIYIPQLWIKIPVSSYVKQELEIETAQKNNSNLLPFMGRLSDDDKGKLVNLTKFGFKIIQKTLCNNKNILLVVVVSSARDNYLNRMTIRKTWGQSDDEVKIVFLLGDAADGNENENIFNENRTFKDIVVGSFLDSYKNTTYKSVMGLKYAIYHCNTAKFLLKCDDDVFVNMPLLKNFLKVDLGILKPNRSIFCNVNTARTPIRESTGDYRKWFISYQEWPEEIFPVYCSGWYYLMPLEVAFGLYKSAQNSSYFSLEDVFLTGIAARNVHGLKYVDMSSFTLALININYYLKGMVGDFPFLFGAVNMNREDILALWQYVQTRPVANGVLYNIIHTVT